MDLARFGAFLYCGVYDGIGCGLKWRGGARRGIGGHYMGALSVDFGGLSGK